MHGVAYRHCLLACAPARWPPETYTGASRRPILGAPPPAPDPYTTAGRLLIPIMASPARSPRCAAAPQLSPLPFGLLFTRDAVAPPLLP
nr:unnamed protein product [Digitaria exilis]